ncbi:MAG: hypothetical protein FWH07_06885 [Oscillospiraceae bacterium]|nr:hypothetical protein [Oscillospiraceae bacterium]
MESHEIIDPNQKVDVIEGFVSAKVEAKQELPVIRTADENARVIADLQVRINTIRE